VIDTSPSESIVVEPVDMLAPIYSAWQRGIDLGPVTPRIREQIVSGYREMLEAATYIGNAAECAYLRKRIAEFDGGQP